MSSRSVKIEQDEESRKRRRVLKIFLAVVLAHVIVLGVPALWSWLKDWFKPKQPATIMVSIAELGADSGGGGTPQPPEQPDQTPPEIQKPEPTPPTPPEPTPPTPTVKTEPVPTPPELVPPKPKPKQKPKPKPVPPKPKPVPPKPKPVPPKPKYLSPEDIAKATKVVRKKSVTPHPQQDFKPLSPAELAQAIGENRTGVRNGNPGSHSNGGRQGPPGPPGPSIGQLRATYGSQLGAYLKPRWNQPSKYELSNQKPEVTIRLNISPDGRVTYAQIIQASNIGAMDRSVQKLLNSLHTVPPPPPEITTIDVILVVED